jgi:hypothetical protein
MYRRPGTYVEEVTFSQNIEAQGLATPVGAFVGRSLRGPVDKPAFVGSWTDFTRTFGQFRSADGAQNYRLAQAIFQFFGNGGRGAWVQRVVGPGAASATINVKDSAAADVLTISAIDPGDWAVGNLYVQVVDVFPTGAGGATVAGDTFTLAVYSGGVGVGHIVERWTDLSLDPNHARYALSIVNAGSAWIKLIRPTVIGFLPPVTNTAPVALAKPSGVLGSLDGTSAPTAAAYTAAAELFDIIDSNLLFNVPDAYDMPEADATLVINTFITKADERGDAFVVVDVPKTAESVPSGAATWALSVNGSANAAIYYPSVLISNPVPGAGRSPITVPPGGSVVGLYHTTDASRGIFKSPAGVGSGLGGVVDVSKRLTNRQLDELNTASRPLNVIRPVPGSGICVMGARTCGGPSGLRYVGTRRTLLAVKKELTDRTQFAVMENNDENLWAKVTTACTVYLSGLWQAGGLKGATPASAFFVKCDGTNNTPNSISSGVLNVEVGVALQTPAEFVVIRIGQFDGGSSVTETN